MGNRAPGIDGARILRGAAAALGLLAAPWVAAAEFRSVGPEAAVLYDGPSLAATRLSVASPSYPLEVVVQLGRSWTKVRDATGDVNWVETRQLSDRRTVLVTAPTADLLDRPQDNGSLVLRLDKDVVLDLVEPATGGWVKVRHRDGLTGYIRAAQVFGQ